MEYKSLLALHCTHDPITSLKPAIALAKHLRAHLDILVLSVAPPVPTMALKQSLEYEWGTSFQDTLQGVLAESMQRVEELTQWLSGSGVTVSVNSSCQQLGLLDNEVAQSALYADLVLYHRCDESMVSGIMAKALEGVIFNAAKPAVILTQRPNTSGKQFQHITIAWDPAPGAMKALTASLPLLKRALEIELVVIAKSGDESAHNKSTEPVLTWLKRHDVNAHLTVVLQKSKSAAQTLLEHVNASRTDLVVMGAYGHTRLSERLFHGVSHTLLEESEKSLFIAH